MVSNKKQLELGYAGLALLRNRLVGEKDITQKIVNEIDKLVKENSTDTHTTEVKEYDLDRGYKAWSKTYDSIPNLLIEVEEPVIKELLYKIKPCRVLDAACGMGRYSKVLFDLGHDVVGVDISSDMLKHAKSKIPKVKFIQGNLTDLPFENDSFDLVICALALSHVSSFDEVINELSRVVCNGGRIILSDIHPWFVIIGGQAEFQNIKGKKGYIFNHVHLHSQYLNAFYKSKLKIKQCVEPTLDSKYLNPTEMELSLSKTTMNTALSDLPIVLIWELQKLKNK